VSLAFMFIVGGAVAGAQAATSDSLHSPTASQVPNELSGAACPSHDARNIVVCGQRRQPYRLDPSVMETGREVESNSRSATSAMPTAQAACSASPMGCTKDLRSLDLANVAVVIGTTVARAAKGDDWAKVFRPGGPGEYQLYQQAKRRREAEAEERAAAEVKRKAEAQEREAHATSAASH
jgi:hypothetical protein